MKIRPIQSHVLVAIKPPKPQTESGILLSEESLSEEEITEGDVVSRADDVDFIEIGQHVYFKKYAGVEVVANSNELLMSVEDIIALGE